MNRYSASPLAPLLALILGALMPLGLAPLTWWPIAILALGLLFELLQQDSAKRAAKIAYCFGLGLWLHGGSWLLVSMHDYGDTSWPLAIVLLTLVAMVMAGFFALIGWLHVRLRLQPYSWLALPALFVFGEWLRSWVLTGFPWLMMGYGFIDTPLAGWAPIVGIYGVSFAAAITATALIRIWRHGKQAPSAIFALAMTWIVGGLLLPISWTEIDKSKPISVSMVQGNIPQESKWALEWRDKTIEIYNNLSANEWGQDVVLWPEAAIPMFAHEATEELLQLEMEALRSNTAFVTGIPFATWNKTQTEVLYYNSIAALGNGVGIYHKQQLVPIGEYIPFENWLRGTIPFFDLPMSSFTWGPRSQAPLMLGDYAMAPFICYEIAYPSLVQRLSRPADYLVTISNDGWFGRSIGPDQHFQMVRMRARETGRYILRGTNNGITAILDDKGDITALAPRFEATVLRGEVYPATGHTPWQRMGVWPLLSSLAALLVLLTGLRWRQQRRQ